MPRSYRGRCDVCPGGDSGSHPSAGRRLSPAPCLYFSHHVMKVAEDRSIFLFCLAGSDLYVVHIPAIEAVTAIHAEVIAQADGIAPLNSQHSQVDLGLAPSSGDLAGQRYRKFGRSSISLIRDLSKRISASVTMFSPLHITSCPREIHGILSKT